MNLNSPCRFRTIFTMMVCGPLWAGSAYADVCRQPLPGLWRYWPANGSFVEAIGSASTSPAGPVSFKAGVFDQAFSLNGGYIQDGDLHLNNGTVEFWVNPASNSADVRLFSQTSGSTTLGGATRIGGAAPGDVQVWTGFQWLSLAPGGSVPVGVWTHLAFVYDGTKVGLYVNGIPIGSQSSRFDFAGPSLGIGAKFLNAFGVTFTGLIDEFSVYNRALAANEIAVVADRSLGPKCLVPAVGAGSDQSADEGSVVGLRGSATSTLAPIDRYEWRQLSGLPASLDRYDVPDPTFIAPYVPRGGATLTFQLVAYNRFGASSPDTVNVTINNINHAPVAVAQTRAAVVQEGGALILTGSASYDPDGEPLTYQWAQLAGSPVDLIDPMQPDISTSAPYVGAAGGSLRFQLVVSDDESRAEDFVDVFVENVNHPPTADAGPDQTRDEGALVSLDGTGSSDPDGDALQFGWVQVSGPSVRLQGAETATPSFVAPTVGPGGVLLEFGLTVTDALRAASRQELVVVRIQDVNDPPVCDTARPSSARLWPPNHVLIPVSILGVSDPNGDRITIHAVGIFQNEPVSGLGDGDTAPDAVITADGVLLRTERSGTGSGRLYHVTFTATDGSGGSCTGAVEVLVPRDVKSSAAPAVDQWYLSTGN
jgi:concanavalin A-like lectin/glucanase superfamily protein/K319-like protein